MDLVTCLLIVWYTAEHASLQRTLYHTEKSNSPNINYRRSDTSRSLEEIVMELVHLFKTILNG